MPPESGSNIDSRFEVGLNSLLLDDPLRIFLGKGDSTAYFVLSAQQVTVTARSISVVYTSQRLASGSPQP